MFSLRGILQNKNFSISFNKTATFPDSAILIAHNCTVRNAKECDNPQTYLSTPWRFVF